MMPVSDFSGLTNCACALASAAAKAATDSLERCMGRLQVEEVKAHSAALRAPRPQPIADRLLGGRCVGEGPGRNDPPLEDCSGLGDNTVEGRDHPEDRRMPDAALDVSDVVARVALVPAPIERLRGSSELDHEIA